MTFRQFLTFSPTFWKNIWNTCHQTFPHIRPISFNIHDTYKIPNSLLENPFLYNKNAIGICSDHAGFETKQLIINWLQDNNYKYIDYGTFCTTSCDYPDFVHPMASDINREKINRGIAICGSGQGMAMTANKYYSIRAAICWDTEIAQMARLHNDANILCIPARYTDQITEIVNTFLTTSFEGGRHYKRIDKIPPNI